MTDQQIRISSYPDEDLLRETLHCVELNAYFYSQDGFVSRRRQSLENDLKRELTRRFLGTREDLS